MMLLYHIERDLFSVALFLCTTELKRNDHYSQSSFLVVVVKHQLLVAADSRLDRSSYSTELATSW